MPTNLKKLSVLICLLACICALAACTTQPELELSEAAQNLENVKYTVTYETDDMIHDISPALEELLDARKGNEHLRIYKFDSAESARLYYESFLIDHRHEVDEIELEIKGLEHLIKTYEDDLVSQELLDLENNLSSARSKLEELKKVSVGQSGEFVWNGTKKAIEKTK